MGDRKLTMKSMVVSLALKFYGEQLVYTYGTDEQKSVVNGYSTVIKEYAGQLGKPDNGTDYKELIKQKNEELTNYVKDIISEIEVKFYEDIRKYDKSYAQVICIKHDRDYNSDDVWEPSIEKPHYHLIMRLVNQKVPVNVSTLLRNPKSSKKGIIEYRKGLDDALFDNNGVQTVGDFQKYTVYLTHETEEAEAEGKARYDYKTEIISNMTTDEIELIRDGYKQVSRVYVKPKDMKQADKIAYELGKKLYCWEDWHRNLPFEMRRQSAIKTIKESYDVGVDEAIANMSELPRLCVFIQGEPNLGKTYSVKETLLKLGVPVEKIFKVTEGTGKFDALTTNHKAIIVDDTTSHSLLNMTDTKPCKVYRRNKGNGVWIGDYFIVTSNMDFVKWALACNIQQDNIAALESRFYILKVNSPKNIQILHRFNRGEDIMFDVTKKFNDFYNTFTKTIANYTPIAKVRGVMEILNYDKSLYNIFKMLVTKYPVHAYTLVVDTDDFYLSDLPCTYTDAIKVREAIKCYYINQPALYNKAKNTFCCFPLPSRKEMWEAVYGYYVDDIEKDLEDLIYQQLDYEEHLHYI